MIKIDNPSGNIFHVVLPHKLEVGDFNEIKRHVDALIDEHGKIRLILDARAFEGWGSVKAAEEHISFVHNHHHKIECAAVLTNKNWQQWLAFLVKGFLDPKVKAFDGNEEYEAWDWVKNSSQ